KAMVERSGVTDMLVAPMVQRGEPVGTIAVLNKHGGAFTQRDAELMQLLGGQAAVALENARVYWAMQQHLAEVVALQEVGAALRAERDARRVMQTIAEQAQRLLGCETVSIELLVPGRPWLEV